MRAARRKSSVWKAARRPVACKPQLVNRTKMYIFISTQIHPLSLSLSLRFSPFSLFPPRRGDARFFVIFFAPQPALDERCKNAGRDRAGNVATICQ